MPGCLSRRIQTEIRNTDLNENRPMNPIFISHATQDDNFVKELRIELEKLGLTVWLDSRNLRGGHKLAA